MTEKNYYSLRFLGNNAFHKREYVLKTTARVLHIGETADCEVRYEAGPYTPEVYATIVADADGTGWLLIQRSAHVKAHIAGTGGSAFVQRLSDGDIIQFDGQQMELEFHTHHDCNYAATAGVVMEHHTSKRIIYGTWAAIALLFAMVLGVGIKMRSDIIDNDQLERFYSSVFITRVDSVQWIQVAQGDTTLVRPTLNLQGEAPVGTAFLTTDGKLVTARHCIEYWIGENIDLTENVENLWDEDIRKWAILSESFVQNREDTDTIQALRVCFSIYNPANPDQPSFCFTSTDDNVHINKRHDVIQQLADYEHDYWWRTVRPYYSNLECERGDIVYIDTQQKGTIQLADSASIAALKQSAHVALLGHPGNAAGLVTTYAKGTMAENRADTLHRYSPALKFDANITHGFSGGPLFIRAGGKIVAAGVVSKIDTDNGIFKKAVPVTEIDDMQKHTPTP